MLNSYIMWTFFPDPTHSYLTISLFCLCKYTIAECPLICSNSILFCGGLRDAALILLLGWLVCSLLAANGSV